VAIKDKITAGRLLISAVVFCLVFLPQGAGAVNKTKEAAKAAVVESPLQKLLAQPFTYKQENRPDPFMPFIAASAIKVAGEPEKTKPLTGMQLFEPGQLNLVGILFNGPKALAMVQDSTGKGYIIKKNTKIGRHGVVTAIMPNEVVIKEWFRRSNGKKFYRDNIMVLRKEGATK